MKLGQLHIILREADSAAVATIMLMIMMERSVRMSLGNCIVYCQLGYLL